MRSSCSFFSLSGTCFKPIQIKLLSCKRLLFLAFFYLGLRLRALFQPQCKERYLIAHNSSNCCVLDVGCLNNSSLRAHLLAPKCHYIGIDIWQSIDSIEPFSDNQEIYIAPPHRIIFNLLQLSKKSSLVIAAHVLEHVDQPFCLLSALMGCVEESGFIFLAFPSAKSVNFPRRNRTLNYYDDPSHLRSPPDLDKALDLLRKNGFSTHFISRSYKPFLAYIIGFALEPLSSLLRVRLPCTWHYYGFETIIYAQRVGYSTPLDNT